MKKWHVVIIVLVVAVLAAGIGVYAATNYGTQSDPLIAQSYLDEVLGPRLRREFDAALDEAVGNLGSEAGAFESVSLTGGSISCAAGTEVIPLGSGAVATGTMIDATAGGVVNAGEALSANHIYLAADALSISADCELMVRGSYSAS